MAQSVGLPIREIAYSMGMALADGGSWRDNDAGARELSRYVGARLRVALHGTARRWAVLSLVLLLHLLLWRGLVQLTQHDPAPGSGVADAITVEFIVPPEPASAPPLDISPVRSAYLYVATPVSETPVPLAAAGKVLEPAQEAPTIEPAARPRLFRPDGSLNVADDLWANIERQTRADGATEYRIADLDKAGHFETKPAMEYRATAFERYWVPNESLLEEWVRRGITKVSIPIPGTNKRITCYTLFLPPAASCGVTNPEQMNERVEIEYVPPPNRNLRTE